MTLIVDHAAPEVLENPEATAPEATAETAPEVMVSTTTPSVIVYTKEKCPGCKATIRSLTKKNIAFEARSIDETPGARDMIASLGHMQAPVVVFGDDHWSGYKPDRIERLAESMS